MRDRKDDLSEFLRDANYNVSSLVMVAGDASNRKYYRVTRENVIRIVMDAPPDKGEDVRPFIRIATWLAESGLSAPRIFETDEERGFLLLEDLGDDLFARLLKNSTANELEMYRTSADVLIKIHSQSPPNLAPYSAAKMSKMAALSARWYRAGALDGPSPQAEKDIRRLMYDRLLYLDAEKQVLIQRDYHAENLLWLPDREGVARVGLLDFQDAMLGHPAYDLVSILQDARRDVDSKTQTEVLHYFMDNANELNGFLTAYHLLGLQRNLRILGVFARLCMRDSKAWYVDFIPRVWGYIVQNITALDDAELTGTIMALLPEPTQEILSKLRAKCP